jgi:hypothetical protein
MKRLALALLVLLLPLPGLLPGAETKEQKGRRLIEEALAAVGGDKFLAMKDRVEAGRAYSFGRQGLRGLAQARMYTRYRDEMGSQKEGLPIDERQSFGKDKEIYAYLYSYGKFYEMTYLGARPMPEDSEDRYSDNQYHDIFNILRLRMQEPGMIFQALGTDLLDNTPVEKVEIIDAENRSVVVYLDRNSKLPLKQIHHRRDRQRQKHEESTVFGKYRDVGDGVLWPLAVQRFRNGEKTYEMYSETVQVNQSLSSNLFELPAKVKVLERMR